jgi:hypothetical protein
MPIICPLEFHKWEERYQDWVKARDKVEDLRDDAIEQDFEFALVCATGAVAATTVLGALLGGGACGFEAYKLVKAVDAFRDGIKERDEANAKSKAQGDAYNKCVSDHKKDS